MSTSIQRLATDWKTYAAGLGAVASALGAVGENFEALRRFGSYFYDLPAGVRWFFLGLLAVISLLVFVSAARRRSVLQQPDRFIVSADDPRHLIGREQELEKLSSECERHSLVFLVGESGAGKSALVRSGLVPRWRAAERLGISQSLTPLLIDLSSTPWHGGFRNAISRALGALSREERHALGAEDPAAPSANEVFEWVATLPAQAPRRLVLVLDQFDDYVVANAIRFIRDGKIATSQKIENANAEWKTIAQLVRTNQLGLLVVVRSDAGIFLESLRFTEPVTYRLPNLDSTLVAPLLDAVTTADEKGEVVTDPEFGWLQLKRRLLRDLAAGGDQVLPVQVAIALDSLRRFRYLTPGEYVKHGGARGLEWLHIARHLREAARVSGVPEHKLFKGLLRLLSDDSAKARAASWGEFAEAVLGVHADTSVLRVAVEHLERWRILRRYSSPDGEVLILHHDYLARGVREAYRHANRWIELLRAHSEAFSEAISLYQKWRALLPLSAQCTLLFGRIRRQFTYGAHRAYAFWSTVRLVPLILLLGLPIGYSWWLHRQQQENLIAVSVSGIGHSLGRVSAEESRNWVRLSSLGARAREYYLAQLLSDADTAQRARKRVELGVQFLVGLDPTGQRGHRLIQERLLPRILQGDAGSETWLAALEYAARLRPDRGTRKIIFDRWIESLATSPPSPLTSVSAAGFEAICCSDLTLSDSRAAGAVLVQKLRDTHEAFHLTVFTGELAALGSRQPMTEEMNEAAEELVNRLAGETGSANLLFLCEGLKAVGSQGDPAQRNRIATVLLEKMKREPDLDNLSYLLSAFGGLGATVDVKLVRQAVELVTARITPQLDGRSSWVIGSALGDVCPNLAWADTKPGFQALLNRFHAEGDSNVLRPLGGVLLRLASKCSRREEADEAAIALLDQIEAEANGAKVVLLGEALSSLEVSFDVGECRIRGEALVSRMRATGDSRSLAGFGLALGALGSNLDIDYRRVGAAILVDRIQAEEDTENIAALGKALSSLGRELDRAEINLGIRALEERAATEPSSWGVALLAEALGGFGPKLGPAEQHTSGELLCRRMGTELDSWALGRLASGLRALSKGLEGPAAKERIRQVTIMLRQPLMVGEARAALLDTIEELAGEEFKGDIWRFVEWATSHGTEEKYALDLGR